MAGFYQNNLEEWLCTFNQSSKEQDSQHIDTLSNVANKKKWVEYALEIHEEAVNLVQEKRYPFKVILAIYLNDRKSRPRHAPRSLSYRNYSYQRKPPELFLVKRTTIIDQWMQNSKFVAQLSTKYVKGIYLNEYYDKADNCFVRTILVTS